MGRYGEGFYHGKVWAKDGTLVILHIRREFPFGEIMNPYQSILHLIVTSVGGNLLIVGATLGASEREKEACTMKERMT